MRFDVTILIDIFSHTAYVEAYAMLFVIFMFVYVFQGMILRTSLLKLAWMTHSKTQTLFADQGIYTAKACPLFPIDIVSIFVINSYE